MTPATKATARAGWHRLLDEARGWGPAGAVLAALLAVALICATWVVPRLEAARSEIEADTAVWRERLAAGRAAAAGEARAVRDAPSLAARFPPARERSQRLAALLAEAERQGLRVQRADLRESPLPVLPELAPLRVVLPVVGTAPAVWAWAGQALERDPALALLQLKLERAPTGRGTGLSEGSALLRAELEFTLWAEASR
jgi:hypothetical protein